MRRIFDLGNHGVNVAALDNRPYFSFGTVSGVPPLANATTGVPQAIASMLTIGRLSSSVGFTKPRLASKYRAAV